MAQNNVQFTINLDGNAQTNAVKLDSAMEKLNATSSNTMSVFDKIGAFAFRINNIFQLAQTAVSKVSGALEKVVSVGSESELQKMNLTTLFEGNAQAAEAMYQKIAKYGKETPYDKAGLIDAQKTMMAFGISGEKAFEKLKQIGDIAMGDKQKMQSLALAFSQISSAGKLSGQDLLQMINQGFNPLKIISDKTGESMVSLRDKMSKGLISVGMVEQAFADATSAGGQFYNAINNAAGTTSGKLGALQDAVNEALVGIFEELKPYIDSAIETATSAIESVLPFIKSLGETIAGLWQRIKNVIGFVKEWRAVLIPLTVAISAFTVACNINRIALAAQDLWLNILIVKEKAIAIATTLWAKAQAVLNAIMSANPIALVIAAIAALTGVITAIIKKYDEWGAAASLLLGPVGAIVNLVMAFRRHWESIKAAFTDGGIIAGIKRIGEVMLDALLMPLQQLLELISAIPGVGKLAGNGAQKIEQLRKKMNVWQAPATTTSTQKALDINNELQRAVNTSSDNGKTLNHATSNSTEAIATGGTRNTDIHIHIEDMIKTVNFNGGVKENIQEIERTFAETLARVLGMAQMSI